jgi:hypothetical protein
MKRERKKKKSIARNSFVDTLIDYQDIVDDIYLKTSSGFACVVKISGIDIFHYSDDDQNMCYNNFAAAELSLKLPHKYVFYDCSPSYPTQKEFINYKLEKQNNPYLKELLQRQLFLFDNNENNCKDRSAYLFIYGKNKSDLKNAAEMFIHKMSDTICEIVEAEGLTRILHDILPFSDSNDYSSFIESICPEKLELYPIGMEISNKYVTSLVAYDFPSSILNLFMANMLNFPDTMATMDLSFIPKDVAKQQITRSLNELRNRQALNNSVADELQDSGDYSDLEKLLDDLNRGNEQLLTATIRIFIAADTEEELIKKKKYIMSEFESDGISLFTPQNEMLKEYMSLSSYSNIINTPIPLQDTFMKQYPFYYQNYIDKHGLYFGETSTHGAVVWDPFIRSDTINSYDMLLIGIKGSGKSVTLKSMVQDVLCLGNKVMVIDIENEYAALAKKVGGKVIKLGSFPVINPLEIRKLYADNDPDKSSNFIAELSRIVTFMYQYIPDLKDQEAEEFKSILLMTYAKFNITADTDVTTLQPTDFPIFSDVLKTLREHLYDKFISDGHRGNVITSKLSEQKITVLERLETYIKNLAEGLYSNIFNGYSAIDISQEDFIVFNVHELSTMDEKVYNAQLFNVLSYMWQEICMNVSRNLSLKNPFDRRHVVAVLDEAHRFINAKNPQALEFIEKLTRRTRKYDAALWFASQSILDFFPKGTKENIDTILTIFSLVQYRIILKQTYDSIESLHMAFPQFTYSELNSTTNFKPGDMLMSFGGTRQKLICHRTIFKEDLLYIGNSRDAEELQKEEELMNDEL